MNYNRIYFKIIEFIFYIFFKTTIYIFYKFLFKLISLYYLFSLLLFLKKKLLIYVLIFLINKKKF